MTSGIQSKGVDLDSIFSPYLAGTTKARATGILVNGTDINNRYANIIYGSAVSATGIDSEGADLNTLFCTGANYTLPINGQTYASTVQVTGANASATIDFAISGGNTWSVQTSNTRGVPAPATLISGSIPAGAATVKFTWGTYVVGPSKVDAGGSTTNGAATATAISSNPIASYTTASNASNSGSRDREYPFTVDFFNSGGTNISHSVCTLIGDTEGSV